MNQSNFDRNANFPEYEYDFEDEGILSRTGTFVSSLFSKVINTINPFKSKKYVQNPYDPNLVNDPCNHVNYLDNNNNKNLRLSSSYPNFNKKIKEQNIRKSNPIYLGNNDFVETNEIKNDDLLDINEDYFTVEEFCKTSPHLRKEIFKDIQRPNYIPNEEIFQKAKSYVYDKLIKQYKIIKPKYNDKIFGESIFLLAIQLTNKYNIEKHYDSLVNNKRNINYRLEINVPEIIKNYYSNKAKTLFYGDITENSDIIDNKLNKELLNKFSHGLFFNEKDKTDMDNNQNNPIENRIICRTPKTKRNYITCLFENKYNYDYLCPNDKTRCQIYKECLIHKENEIRNYARVIEVTNNMFKFICNENEKLRDIIKQKEEKIEEYTKQIILNKIKDSEKDQKIINYENELKDLKNNVMNNFESVQKNSNNNLINRNINSFNQNSTSNNNINLNNNLFTLKKPLEINSVFSFSSNNANQLFSNSNKNNKDPNLFLVLKSQSNEHTKSLIKEEDKESEQKKESKLFGFIQSEEKKEEIEKKIDVNDLNKNEKKDDSNNTNINNPFKNEQKLFNFGCIDKKSEETIKDEKKDDNEKNNNKENQNKVIFGFNSEVKNENENSKEEDDKIEGNNVIINSNKEKDLIGINKEKEKINSSNEVKKEENNNKILLATTEVDPEKIEGKNQQIIQKQETLNNPTNPFLSTVNIKTNEEFSTNFLNDIKDKNKNDVSNVSSNRNTMDNTNNIVKFGEPSNRESGNSNPFIIPMNNFISDTNNSQPNPFLSNQSSIINENKNFAFSQTTLPKESAVNFNDNNTSKNIFLNIINNDNKTSDFNEISNNNYNLTTNPFLVTSKSQNNNSNNNPFLSFNSSEQENDNFNKSQNPFITKNLTQITNNFNNNETKTNTNPFISSLTNAIINSTSNNNTNNNNPFLSFNNNNNGSINIPTNNSSSNNPFVNNNTLSSDKSPKFGINNNISNDNTNSLFNFKINTQENNRVNPFLEQKNGFDFSSQNNSTSSFSLGVNMKKNGDNYSSIFDGNKSRKIK